jgi:hypothetical protein
VTPLEVFLEEFNRKLQALVAAGADLKKIVLTINGRQIKGFAEGDSITYVAPKEVKP